MTKLHNVNVLLLGNAIKVIIIRLFVYADAFLWSRSPKFRHGPGTVHCKIKMLCQINILFGSERKLRQFVDVTEQTQSRPVPVPFRLLGLAGLCKRWSERLGDRQAQDTCVSSLPSPV